MVTRTTQKTTQYLYRAESFTSGNNIVWGARSSTPYTYTARTTAITSVSTPNYWKRKIERAVYVPRKGRYMTRPIPPVLRLPSKPIEPYQAPFKPLKWPRPYLGKDPQKVELSIKKILDFQKKEALRLRRHRSRYKKYLDRYKSKYVLYERTVQARKTKYALALKKYHRRLDLYNQQQSRIKTGKSVFKRVRNIKAIQNNPYTKTETTFIPCMGEYDTYLYYKDNGNNTHSPVSSLSAANLVTRRQISGAVEAFLPRSIIPDVSAKSAALSSAESRAISKVFEKLKSDHVHIGNIVAERAKTIEMFLDIVRAIKNPLRLAKNLNLKRISDDFLAFQFGVRPLLNDAYSAGTQLAKILDSEKSDRIMVYAKGHGKCSSISKTTRLSSGFPYCDTYVEAVYDAEVRYVLEYRVSNAPLNQLQALGLVNPAEIAWEVMPWSFVIDWFVPIGNWIANLNADAGLTFVTGTKTVVTHDSYSICHSGKAGFNASESNERRIRAFGSETRMAQTRTVLSSRIGTPWPEFKSPVSAYHLSEAIALLVQRFK